MAALPQAKHERRPYVAPALKKLTPVEALSKLKRAANAGSRAAKAMLKAAADKGNYSKEGKLSISSAPISGSNT